MYRTHTNGALRASNINQEVTLSGWVQKIRNKGFLIWVDLRDRYGITQLIGIGKVDTLTIRVMQFVREANPYLAAVTSCLMIAPPLLLLAINKKAFLKK